MTGPLTEQARALGRQIEHLSLAVERLDRRTNRSEKATLAVVFGLLLDLVLSVAVALVLANQVTTNERIQAAVDRESLTRQEAVCPLYALVIGSYSPNSRAEGPDRDAYNEVYDRLRAGYASLECTVPITPPRIDASLMPTPIPMR